MVNIIPPRPPYDVYTPIWIDTTYTFTGVTNVSYQIRDEFDDIIFAGKAFAYPNTNSCTININRVCENYLENELTILTQANMTGTTTLSYAARQFYLCDSQGEVIQTYKFYWNYNYNEVIYRGGISEVINGHYAQGMYRLDSNVSENGLTVSWSKNFSNWGRYTTSACGDYALYYLNRNGGWDSFLIEGKVIEKDTYKRTSFENKPSQVEYWKRETKTFKNQIEHNYELNTDWLTDEQSEILAYHLLSSNNVYLHNLNTNIIIPVNITDTSTEYKYFKNKRKLNSYTIKVVESNKQTIL